MPDYEYEYEYEHDLDRTQREFESALQELQPEHFEMPGEEEYFGEGEYFGETEAGSTPYETGSYRAGFQYPSQEAEELELELAAELLEVTSEEELDRFLGDVFKKVGGFVSSAVKSPVFKALGGVLKPIAKAALPIAGGALGTLVGGPAGGMIGSKLASAAGNLFGLELEGLSAEDREFETAKGFVRLATGAAEQVKHMHFRPGQNPEHAAKTAVMRAGQQHLGVRPGAITENIDITIDTGRPRPHHHHRHAPGAQVPGAQVPGAQVPGWQAPRPQAPGWQAPRPQAAGPQAPRPQAPGSPAPQPQATAYGPQAAASGPHTTADGSPHPGATNGAPPLSHGGFPPESLPAGAKRKGTWFRRGQRIILIGV
jgi:hypothetical protein